MGTKAEYNKLVQYCIDNIDFEKENEYDFYYSCLPFCVVDAVFSIGVKYENVKKVIGNLSERFQIPIKRETETFTPTDEQCSVSNFLEIISNKSIEDLADNVFKNRQRSSTQNGILKVDAIIQFLKVLQDLNVEYFQDVWKVQDSLIFDQRIKEIEGQASGISLKYFFMLAENSDLIKPDRMIDRFLEKVTGVKHSHSEMQKVLKNTADTLSLHFNKKITPMNLDNLIWQMQRESE